MSSHDRSVPQRQPSPGLHILQRSAHEVKIEDSLEAESKLFTEAEILAVERGIPSAGPRQIRSPDNSVYDLNASTNSTTIQAALNTSQQTGQPVLVSLPTATPKKSASQTHSSSMMPDNATVSTRVSPRTSTVDASSTPIGTVTGVAGSSSATGKLPRSPANALSSTVPVNIKNNNNHHPHSGSQPYASHGGTGIGTEVSAAPLHHTSPNVAATLLRDKQNGLSMSSMNKAVTINEQENTISSPGPALSPTHSHSPVRSSGSPGGRGAIPKLKDAGSASSALDDMVDVNALVRQARLKASPRGKEELDEQEKSASASTFQQPYAHVDQAALRAQEESKARAKASYLRKRDAASAARRGGNVEDNASSIASGSSGRSSQYQTSASHISKRLSASQEGGWADKVTSSLSSLAGNKGFSAAQETLFLSMKLVKPIKGRSSARGGSRSSSESKNGGSSRYDSDEGDNGGRRPSTADSVQSSGGSARSSRNTKEPYKVSTREMRDISNRLTQPVKVEYSAQAKKADPTLSYLLLEEAKECNRKPFKSKPWAESSRSSADDAKGTANNSFTERMEAQERARRQELEDAIAQADYDARLDQKVCPVCQAKQSYKEVKMRIFKCSVCSEEFQPRLTWAKVSKRFFQRGKGYDAQSKVAYEKLLKQIEEENKVQVHAYNSKTGKVEAVVDTGKQTKWDDNTSNEFFTRMEEKLDLRETRLQRVEERTFGSTCTFHPHIARVKKVGSEDDDEDEEEEGTAADRAQAFMDRFEADMEERRKNFPEKYATKHEKDAKSAARAVWN